MADNPPKESFSRAEVEEILRRAAERMKDDGAPALSRDELLDAAREAGIEPTFVQEAADELASVREEDRAIAAFVGERKRRFARSALVWAVVCTGLLAINLIGGGRLWFQWPLFGWGIAIALHALRAYRAPSPKDVAAVKKRERERVDARKREDAQRREQEDAIARALAEKERRHRAVRDFEGAVDRGLTALLDTATKKLESATAPRPARPQTDFDRFVAKKKAEQAKPSPVAPPGTRVDAPSSETQRNRVATGEGLEADNDPHEESRRSGRSIPTRR